jgi:hypothetical protein
MDLQAEVGEVTDLHWPAADQEQATSLAKIPEFPE